MTKTGIRLTAMLLGLTAALSVSGPTAAQDLPGAEVVVTAQRARPSYLDGRNQVIQVDDSAAGVPAIGLRRRADFALLPVMISGDTRERDPRREEILTMVRAAIERAGAAGIELAIGDFIVTPLTAANFRTLNFVSDGRPDSERVIFFIKTRLGASNDEANQAIQRLENFIRQVPRTGRAQMQAAGNVTLSIVGPDQYRNQLLDRIAEDARAIAARFGPDQRIDASGLDRPVEWRRAGATEVFLYIPYSLTFRPAG